MIVALLKEFKDAKQQFFLCFLIGKPISYIRNITIGVTYTTGIELPITIIAYPEPLYKLQFENGTRNNQMLSTIPKNGVNNFTVRIIQDVVEKSTFGVYHLRASNIFGETTVIVNVIEQSKWLGISKVVLLTFYPSLWLLTTVRQWLIATEYVKILYTQINLNNTQMVTNIFNYNNYSSMNI